MMVDEIAAYVVGERDGAAEPGKPKARKVEHQHDKRRLLGH
jgi:hypothetical protein